MSGIDGLTKISNHRSLIEFLESEIVDASRLDRPLSVAIFDIDDYKEVNDCNGHICGDHVLVEVAGIIKENIRNTDLAGRYGGDEFMVIFSNADIMTATNISERIKQAVDSNYFINGIKITLSGGVKQYKGESLSDLIHFADMNLYEAKNKGKNGIVS